MAAGSTMRARQHVHQLFDLAALLLEIAALHRLLHAVADVVAQHLLLHPPQRRAHGQELGDNVDAVAVLLDHAGEAAHLALDAAQAPDAGSLGRLVHALTYTLEGYTRSSDAHTPEGFGDGS